MSLSSRLLHSGIPTAWSFHRALSPILPSEPRSCRTASRAFALPDIAALRALLVHAALKLAHDTGNCRCIAARAASASRASIAARIAAWSRNVCRASASVWKCAACAPRARRVDSTVPRRPARASCCRWPWRCRGGSRGRFPRGSRNRRRARHPLRPLRSARGRRLGVTAASAAISPSISLRALSELERAGPLSGNADGAGPPVTKIADADADFDQAADLERDHRFADRRARHAEQRRQLAFGRQPGTRGNSPLSMRPAI